MIELLNTMFVTKHVSIAVGRSVKKKNGVQSQNIDKNRREIRQSLGMNFFSSFESEMKFKMYNL